MDPVLTIWQAAPRIRQGELQPLDLLEATLARIERYDERLAAWTFVDQASARAQAIALGKELTSGHYRGPLHGIPIGIKDTFDVQSMPTRAGSSLTEEAPARHDAAVVAKLRTAGTIILGKTVTTEFAYLDPSPTRNPWNEGHTPGGSSSGSAAAVAAGMCLAALGSQTGGSITRPASYCGVAGYKPTFNSIPRQGLLPCSTHLDQIGVFTRSVADLACLLHTMSSADRLVNHFAARLRRSPKPCLGLLHSYFMEEASEPVRQTTEDALHRLVTDDADVVVVQLPEGFSQVHTMHHRIMAFETARVHKHRFPSHRDQFGPEISALLDEGLTLPESAYQEALNHQQQFRQVIQHALHDVDALLTPATPTTAPANRRTTGTSCFNAPWTYSGLPTVTIPCGTASNGMPVGLQLIGPLHEENQLLTTAAWCEKRLSPTSLPPLV